MTSKLTYASAKIQDLCLLEKASTKALGPKGSKKLRMRVKELETATNTQQLVAGTGGWHPIPHDWPGAYGAHLNDGKTIIARPTAGGWLVECVGDCYKH